MALATVGEGAMQDIVFINIGWMVEYRGDIGRDPIRGGHGYIRKNGEGHEAFNFKPKRGLYYGYVPGRNNIRIRNFANHTRDLATGITVVWVARHPENGRYVIVGWYRDATIFKLPQASAWRLGSEHIFCQITAPEAGSKLVPRELRTFPSPDLPQIGFGRSVIYYGNDELNPVVRKFIDSDGTWQGATRKKRKESKRAGGGRQADLAERRRIEKAAIAHATAYYRTAMRDRTCVTSVEHLARGWDLEVRQRSGEILYIEVKGTSGRHPAAELTPNEYEQVNCAEIRSHYVIYIVTEAGTASEKAHIFRYKEAAELVPCWSTDDNRILSFKDCVAARISAPHLAS